MLKFKCVLKCKHVSHPEDFTGILCKLNHMLKSFTGSGPYYFRFAEGIKASLN